MAYQPCILDRCFGIALFQSIKWARVLHNVETPLYFFIQLNYKNIEKVYNHLLARSLQYGTTGTSFTRLNKVPKS